MRQTPVPPGARPQRVIAVLGMHRSGTSALVGTLQAYGLFLGSHSTQNRYNRRGNRENLPAQRLNDQILVHNGGTWKAPPPKVEWLDWHFDRAREILAEYADRPLWGFKDPRTLLTVEGWQQLLPDLEFVGVFRHPARVAHSLASRPELPVEDPVGAWRAYNERLLALYRKLPFPVVCFDDDVPALERNMRRVAMELGLSGEASERFFTEELRTAEPDPIELPPDVLELYEDLRAIAL